MIAPLADSFLAKAIEFLVDLLQRAATVDAEDDDGVAAALAVEVAHPGRRERAVGLAQREGHGKRYLEHLVARGVARAGEDLVAKRLVEVGHAHHAGACQALLVKELLQVGRERRGRKVVAGHVAVYARRVQELGEKLLGQLLLRLRLRHAHLPSRESRTLKRRDISQLKACDLVRAGEGRGLIFPCATSVKVARAGIGGVDLVALGVKEAVAHGDVAELFARVVGEGPGDLGGVGVAGKGLAGNCVLVGGIGRRG